MARSDPHYIEWLGRVEGPPATIGGKAASLDRLARFGFRIPPGFCLTTEAFHRQVVSLADGPRLLGELASSADPAGGEQLAGALLRGAMDPGVATALRHALTALDAEATSMTGREARLAVRSSAIGEDGGEASYAGLHETELDRTPGEVADAVRRCWASLWSGPALAYRVRRSLPLDGGAMAVVVQQLVPADAAAVAFTRHPVTGRTDQVVLTTVRGLGDAMVSGTVTPDTFTVDKATRRTLEFSPGDGPERSIDDEELTDLVGLCLQVEERFGAAVDIEAAISDGRWYLLQARPITTGAVPSAAAGAQA